MSDSWEWLRVGRRIELVAFLCGLFCFLIFALPATIYVWKDGALVLGILLTACAGFSLTLCIPMYLFLRFRRKKDMERQGRSGPSITPLSRNRVYALMAVVTLISATFQVSHMELFEQLWGPSIARVFLWNFGILGVVILINELMRRQRK
jgi:hypothetical protein